MNFRHLLGCDTIVTSFLVKNATHVLVFNRYLIKERKLKRIYNKLSNNNEPYEVIGLRKDVVR